MESGVKKKKKIIMKRTKIPVDDEEKKNRWPIAFFFMGIGHVQMYAVCERRGPGIMLRRLEEGDHNKTWGSGYIATESRIYRIGGDIFDRDNIGKEEYPKHVFYCNFSYTGGEGVVCCSKWEKGPSLSGCKPNPLLEVVNGKIYALGGTSRIFSDWIDSDYEEDSDDEDYSGVRSPMFEVLDPLASDEWETLPQPPFIRLYRENGPKIQWHTVIHNVIYMHVASNSFRNTAESRTLYSFDTAARKWKAHTPNPSPSSDDELFSENLRRTMNVRSAPQLFGNKLFWFDFSLTTKWWGRERMFVFDLKLAELDSRRSLVLGLEHVFAPIDCNMAEGFLTHLGGNSFSFLIFYIFGHEFYARTCTFELLEMEPLAEKETCSLLATNIYYRDQLIPMFACGITWCKVPVPS